ncbi:MAG: LysR substrate-binding domain-containing protein, partial [Actinomycetota bacterium]|nr:LysR substrate-binding domain-containing protein [Actinomycetota bacterium]
AVGGIPSSLDMLVAPAVAELTRTEPRMLVRIREVETADAFEQVLSGELDVAVFVPNHDCPPTDDPRFEQDPLLDVPQDLLVPAGHRLAGEPGVTLDRAAHEPWILPAPDSCDQYELALVACMQAGFRPTVAHETKEWAATAALVGHGLGVALVPRLVRIPEGRGAVRVPVSDPASPRRRLLTCIRRGSGGQRAIALGLAALAAAAERAVAEPVTT